MVTNLALLVLALVLSFAFVVETAIMALVGEPEPSGKSVARNDEGFALIGLHASSTGRHVQIQEDHAVEEEGAAGGQVGRGGGGGWGARHNNSNGKGASASEQEETPLTDAEISDVISTDINIPNFGMKCTLISSLNVIMHVPSLLRIATKSQFTDKPDEMAHAMRRVARSYKSGTLAIKDVVDWLRRAVHQEVGDWWRRCTYQNFDLCAGWYYFLPPILYHGMQAKGISKDHTYCAEGICIAKWTQDQRRSQQIPSFWDGSQKSSVAIVFMEFYDSEGWEPSVMSLVNTPPQGFQLKAVYASGWVYLGLPVKPYAEAQSDLPPFERVRLRHVDYWKWDMNLVSWDSMTKHAWAYALLPSGGWHRFDSDEEKQAGSRVDLQEVVANAEVLVFERALQE